MAWVNFNRKYKKRKDGRQNTSKELLGLIVNDLRDLNPIVKKNELIINGNVKVSLNFERKQYVSQDVLAYSVPISLSPEGFDESKYIELWGFLNLEILRGLFQPDNKDGISIRVDEAYEESKLHEDMINVYQPVLLMLSDYRSCYAFLKGEDVNVHGTIINTTQLDKILDGMKDKLYESSNYLESQYGHSV